MGNRQDKELVPKKDELAGVMLVEGQSTIHYTST